MNREKWAAHRGLVVVGHVRHEMLSSPTGRRATVDDGEPLGSALMDFHDITMTSITGDQVTFDEYRGKLALVVNVASA